MRVCKTIAITVFWVLVVAAVQPVLQAEESVGKKLIVGTKPAPPFAIKNADGTWNGISIDLWREIAAELKLDYELREFDLKGLFEGLRQGSLDAAVAALTVTPEREEFVDFTHLFHTSGLGIAVAPRKGRWLAVLRRFFSWTFLKVVIGLMLILLLAGTVLWFFERRRNPEHFGGGLGKGLGAGFWWSAVTMTTVGYGDKAPKTAAGRAVALIWMFMGIVLISGFTAALASVLTTVKLESPVRGPEDLPGVRVSTVAGTTSENYLRDQHIRFRAYQSPDEALNSVAAGKADAVVYDAPILRYLVRQRNDTSLQVLHRKFERQDYGFALPSGSPLRESINRVLLRKIGDPAWQDTLYKYLGS